MEIEVLEDLGLSNAEAKIYLALLQAGQTTTGIIIDTTKLQSSTVYHVLGSLIEKGLVNYIFIGKVKNYQAETPESFLAFLEEKKRKFKEILPNLKSRESIGKKRQTAKVYQGMKGLKTAFNDVLNTMKSGEEYYFFQVDNEKLFNEKVVRFFRNYHIQRSKKGIKAKGMAKRESKKIMSKIYNLPHTKVKYVEEFMPNGLVIYKNKLITLDWDDIPTAFIIESESVANSYKRFFEDKWKTAKP